MTLCLRLWQGQSWVGSVRIDDSTEGYTGSLEGNESVVLDDGTSVVTFDKLTLSAVGGVFLRLELTSVPEDYVVVGVVGPVNVERPVDTLPVIEQRQRISLVFDGSYALLVRGKEKTFLLAWKNEVIRQNAHFNVTLSNFEVRPGSKIRRTRVFCLSTKKSSSTDPWVRI